MIFDAKKNLLKTLAGEDAIFQAQLSICVTLTLKKRK